MPRSRGYHTREEFVDVCAWKTARSRSKVASSTESEVAEATGRAMASDHSTERDPA